MSNKGSNNILEIQDFGIGIDEIEQKPYIKNHLFLESDTCQKGYDLIHEIKNIAIDLQWSLTEKRKSKYFAIDLQNLRNNLTYINIGGRKVSQFSNEDMFLFLCFFILLPHFAYND